MGVQNNEHRIEGPTCANTHPKILIRTFAFDMVTSRWLVLELSRGTLHVYAVLPQTFLGIPSSYVHYTLSPDHTLIPSYYPIGIPMAILQRG